MLVSENRAEDNYATTRYPDKNRVCGAGSCAQFVGGGGFGGIEICAVRQPLCSTSKGGFLTRKHSILSS